MTRAADEERVGAAWRAHHAYLVDLAYRIVGDVGAAEDAVQEAFARLARTAAGEVDDDRGWLTVVTGRLCLDQVRSARSRRERAADVEALEPTSLVGQAGPADPADRVTLDDEVQQALFVVLQRLSAAERVAFVLHDVFQTPFDAIAETLGRPAATCRQLARRARQKVASAPLRSREVAPAEHRRVTERFITACANGDLDSLLEVLDPQVWGLADLGAYSPAEPQVDHGADTVARTLLRYFGQRTTLVSQPAHGRLTLLAFVDRVLFAIIAMTVEGDRVTTVRVVADPDAFRRAGGVDGGADRADRR